MSVLLCLGVPSRPSPGSDPGPVQVLSRVRRGPVQIRHVLCFTGFWTHPGPEVGPIPACPGPILVPSVPSRIGPGQPEADFLATSEQKGWIVGARNRYHLSFWRFFFSPVLQHFLAQFRRFPSFVGISGVFGVLEPQIHYLSFSGPKMVFSSSKNTTL